MRPSPEGHFILYYTGGQFWLVDVAKKSVRNLTQASERDVANIGFYYVYGLFKIAVIAQQIYARYRQGYTQDARFAALLPAIQALGRTAVRAMASGPLAGLDR